MKRLLQAGLVFLAIYAAAAAAIAAVGLLDADGMADVIVVPGNTVNADGSLSARLKARLDASLELFRQGKAARIFVSGGIGHEGHSEPVAMADYLMSNGVPATAIIQDPLGLDTAATASNVATYLRANNLKSAIIATQYFHIVRTRLALQKNGVQVTGSRYATFFEPRDAYSLAREVIGFVSYYLKA